jgi:type II secretory pathway pseudopilin PulG
MRAEPRRPHAGAALLEVLVALTILATAGVAAVAATAESARAAARLRETERELREASAFLEAVALWPREDLDRRLGDRAQGAWRLRIDRSSPTVYDVVLADSTGARVILETALYRPEPPAVEGASHAP